MHDRVPFAREAERAQRCSACAARVDAVYAITAYGIFSTLVTCSTWVDMSPAVWGPANDRQCQWMGGDPEG